MSSLGDKLKRLLALATLRPGEEDDESRVNEARTASFLLIKTVQENGVRMKFILPSASAKTTVKSPPESQERGMAAIYADTDSPDIYDIFVSSGLRDIFERLQREAERQKRAEAQARANREAAREEASPFRAPRGPYNTYAAEGSVLLSSKFAGRCRKCEGHYNLGERVWWMKGEGCRHERCGPHEE